jgi:hypothetical protein
MFTMKLFFYIFIFCFTTVAATAQKKDSVVKQLPAIADSSKKTIADTSKKVKPHDPRIATKRSAMLPGWGQAYNGRYWKIPIVWGALGTCVGFFVYNRSEYVAARDAYRNKLDNNAANDDLIKAKFRRVEPESIRLYRNGVRQNVDYSVLAFLVCWGLNVVDATVDGHLKEFNVNENLSMRINPSYIPQTRQTGVSVMMRFGK